MTPQDFLDRGFVADLNASETRTDVWCPAIGPNDYFERMFCATFDHLIRSAVGAGYEHIAVMGLSLGAFGAIRYAIAHDRAIEQILLLAPFLANSGIISEVERAGGLAHWTPGPLSPHDVERPGLAWLQKYQTAAPPRPRLSLGYGTQDRFAAAARLIAEILPPERTITAPGGHEWQTWRLLWQRMLADHSDKI